MGQLGLWFYKPLEEVNQAAKRHLRLFLRIKAFLTRDVYRQNRRLLKVVPEKQPNVQEFVMKKSKQPLSAHCAAKARTILLPENVVILVCK